jgi:hypothetical protein
MKEWRKKRGNEDPREKEWRELLAAPFIAKNKKEEKLSEEKLAKFKRENADLVDEIHTRRWTSPY